jgi:hypothetical protein
MFGTTANNSTAGTEAVVQPDTTQGTDTGNTAALPAPNNSPAANDTALVRPWKVYLRVNKPMAEVYKAADRYKSYGMNTTVEPKDSAIGNLYLVIQAAPKDTAFKRDSLRKWFARPIRLVPMNP